MERKFKQKERKKPLTDLGKPTKNPNQPNLEKSTITEKKEK
ncbi:hypothetical protein [Aquimarina celericrescens]|uniref:Uncharacterized protein n=1 Tax=Aquimarina celericrescens TaxID=1964542 RepID=A0ABW5AYF5_9FLAO